MAGERIYETWQNLVIEVQAIAARWEEPLPGGLSSVPWLLERLPRLGRRMDALRFTYGLAITHPDAFTEEQADEFDAEAAALMTELHRVP